MQFEIIFVIWDKIVSFFSGEGLVKHWPNGGAIIFLRAIWITVWLYILTIVIANGFDSTRTWEFSKHELFKDLSSKVDRLGAILGGVYALLYFRFSSQFQYLSQLYNQIHAVQARVVGGQFEKDAEPILNQLKAGFIEDADGLHLATKPVFLTVVKRWGAEEGIKEAFKNTTPGGEKQLKLLLERVERIYTLEKKRWEN